MVSTPLNLDSNPYVTCGAGTEEQVVTQKVELLTTFVPLVTLPQSSFGFRILPPKEKQAVHAIHFSAGLNPLVNSGHPKVEQTTLKEIHGEPRTS
jgi:hypothetical protein